MGCCGSRESPLEQVQAALVKELSQLDAVIPGAYYAIIITPQGETLCAFVTPETEQQHMESIVALKRAALQFAASLGQRDSRIIHVTGDNTLFSCYDIGEDLLACNAKMDAETLDELDEHVMDEDMQPTLQRIASLVTQFKSLRATKRT